MDKIWLKSYPPGVPAEINVSEFGSLKEIAEQSFRKFANADAYVQMGRTMSYAELDGTRRGILQHGYKKTAALKKGDRLAIMLPNVLQYPVAMLAKRCAPASSS